MPLQVSVALLLFLIPKTINKRKQIIKIIKILIGTFVFCFLAGCTSTHQKIAVSNEQHDFSCGLRSLSTYAKLTGENDLHQIKDIFFFLDKEAGEPVSMLELKKEALQLGFEAEGYLLDAKNLEGIESYAIIPIGDDRKGSTKDPLHFVLVRFTNGRAFSVDYQTLEETPLKIPSLKRIWRGHALLIRER